MNAILFELTIYLVVQVQQSKSLKTIYTTPVITHPFVYQSMINVDTRSVEHASISFLRIGYIVCIALLESNMI